MQLAEPTRPTSLLQWPETNRTRLGLRASRWLRADSRGLRIAAAAVCLILAACGAVLWLGMPHQAIYGHDTFIQLDGGWRVLHGQKPHVDFYSAFGPVPYLISAAGLASAKLRVEGMVNATAAVGLVLGIWCWILVRNRLKAWAGLLFLVLMLSLWLAPFPLGESFYMTGYAMQYNRLGYALVSLILLEVYAPLKRVSRQIDLGGISTGIATALLLFIKVSFVAAALALIAGGYLLAGKKRRHFGSMLLGFALVAVPLLAYLNWNLSAMLHDFRIAAAARKTRFFEGYDPFRSLLRNVESIVALLGLSFLVRSYLVRGHASPRRSRGVLAFALLVLAADLLLAMCNTQRSGFPLALAAIVLVASRIGGPPLRSIVLLTLISLLPTLSATANGWAMVLRTNVLAKSASTAASFDAPHLAKLILENHDEPGIDPAAHNGALYVSRVNQGLELLRAASLPQERIACLWFTNPFSYALLRTPATGGSAFWAYGVNFTPAAAPQPAQILGNADVVMQPRNVPDDVDAQTLMIIAGPELRAHYRIAAESGAWILWRHI